MEMFIQFYVIGEKGILVFMDKRKDDRRKTDRRNNKKIGFTCSCFDLLHAGHLIMLKDAKSQCDKLIVGLQTDPSVDRKDKNKPIQTLEERKIQLEAVKYIDEIIVYETENDLQKLLFELDPDVRILGSDWKRLPFTGYSLHIPIYFHDRTHNYSTSSLRKKIWEQENEIQK